MDDRSRRRRHLAKAVNRRLVALGLESPLVRGEWPTQRVRRAVGELLAALGQLHGGVRRTPLRVARATKELLHGLSYANFPQCLRMPAGYAPPFVLCDRIPFNSTCEHHLLPFVGVAAVGYVPKKYLVGLSKVPRLVRFFAARLQHQERLTRQIKEAMKVVTRSEQVGVVIQAIHACVACRGVRNATRMRTIDLADLPANLHHHFFPFTPEHPPA